MNITSTRHPRTTTRYGDVYSVTKRCEGCHRELHLVMDSQGSYWMHASAYLEHVCFETYRRLYEEGVL
jgi:hypothetical protein